MSKWLWVSKVSAVFQGDDNVDENGAVKEGLDLRAFMTSVHDVMLMRLVNEVTERVEKIQVSLSTH